MEAVNHLQGVSRAIRDAKTDVGDQEFSPPDSRADAGAPATVPLRRWECLRTESDFAKLRTSVNRLTETIMAPPQPCGGQPARECCSKCRTETNPG